jgi:hypothetical protein
MNVKTREKSFKLKTSVAEPEPQGAALAVFMATDQDPFLNVWILLASYYKF